MILCRAKDDKALHKSFFHVVGFAFGGPCGARQTGTWNPTETPFHRPSFLRLSNSTLSHLPSHLTRTCFRTRHLKVRSPFNEQILGSFGVPSLVGFASRFYGSQGLQRRLGSSARRATRARAPRARPENGPRSAQMEAMARSTWHSQAWTDR